MRSRGNVLPMAQMLYAVTLRLGKIIGNAYAKAYMKVKEVDRSYLLEMLLQE